MLPSLPKGLRQFILHRRQEDGSVLPCLFIVETPSNVIVSEACGATMLSESTQNISSWVSPLPAPPSVHRQADNDAMTLLLDVLTSSAPCNAPGCDGWRAQLQTELDKLPPDCTTCDRNAVVRRVAKSLEPAVTGLLEAHPEYRLQKSA